MDNSNKWKEIYKNTTFGNKFASSYFVSLFHNRIKPILLKNKKAEEVNVLDFGCSFGANSKILEACGMNVFGIDISEIAVEEARRNVQGRFEVVNLLENNIDLNGVFGRVFDFIIASECMYYFTDKERCLLNKKFYDAMNDDGVIYVNMPAYNSSIYSIYKDVEKDDDGMIDVLKSGMINDTLRVNLPRDINGLKGMFSLFNVIDIITTDTPIYSKQHEVEYHLLAEK